MTRILLVDDEQNILKSLRRVLASFGAEIEMFSDQQAALDRAQEVVFDVVVSDFRMPGMDGVEFLTEFAKLQPDATRIILSGQVDRGGLMMAINKAKIFRFIEKPWDDDVLKATLTEAIAFRSELLEEHELADESRQRRGTLDSEEYELRKLERESPGLTRVERDEDGAIILSDEET